MTVNEVIKALQAVPKKHRDLPCVVIDKEGSQEVDIFTIDMDGPEALETVNIVLENFPTL